MLSGVLQNRKPQHHAGLIQQKRAHFRQELAEPRQPELVNLRGTLALAQPDREHLQKAALVLAGERRVRLDPIEQDDPIRLIGISVDVDG